MKRAIVVYGYGGLDEASLEGDNKIFDIMIRDTLFSSLSLFEG